MATGALSNFYETDFSSRSDALLNFRSISGTDHILRGNLPVLTITGNSPEENIEERITSRGHRIGRMGTLRTIEASDGNSTFFQEGTGSDATRTWMGRDGRMIERDEDSASIYLRGSNNSYDPTRRYEIDIDAGSISRSSGSWLVTQETSDTDNGNTSVTSDRNLNIDVTGSGIDSETSLNFSSMKVSYHATSNGIEIAFDNGRFRFLLRNGILHALNPVEASSIDDGTFYTGTDGRTYRSREISQLEADKISDTLGLGLNSTRGITVSGLTVSVDADGNVIASTEVEGEEQPLSITISEDGTQTVTTSDGYTSRIGPDGRVIIFDAQGNCEAFFDPYTGIVGNEAVQFGAEFTYVDGLYVNMMGMVFEMVALHKFAKDRAEAGAQANVALTQSQTNMDFVRGRMNAGTIGPDCFGALNGSVNQLTSALGACLASGANENIAAIVAAIGDVYTQMTLAHFKYNSYLAGQQMGCGGSLLAKMQQVTGACSDPTAVARQFTAA